METKSDKRKKPKKAIKMHDLKPKKDAKGGWGVGRGISTGN